MCVNTSEREIRSTCSPPGLVPKAYGRERAPGIYSADVIIEARSVSELPCLERSSLPRSRADCISFCSRGRDAWFLGTHEGDSLVVGLSGKGACTEVTPCF